MVASLTTIMHGGGAELRMARSILSGDRVRYKFCSRAQARVEPGTLCHVSLHALHAPCSICLGFQLV